MPGQTLRGSVREFYTFGSRAVSSRKSALRRQKKVRHPRLRNGRIRLVFTPFSSGSRAVRNSFPFLRLSLLGSLPWAIAGGETPLAAAQSHAPEQSANIEEIARQVVRNQAQPREPREPTVDVHHTSLDLTVDLRQRTVSGTATITFAPFARARDRIELHGAGLTIDSVLDSEGRPVPVEARDGLLHFRLPREVAVDQTERLAIRYSVSPTRGMFFVGSSEHPRSLQAWTQGQTELNRGWFPCHDVPRDRGSVSLKVTVREEFRTVSNGRLISSQPLEEGWRMDEWQLDQEIPAYLVTLAVGAFEEVDLGAVDDCLLWAYGRSRDVPLIREHLAVTADAMVFLEDLAGMPYPYAAYRQVLVDEFPYGGMENATATTLDSGKLRKAGRSRHASRDFESLLVHELAHHWWGNPVTASDWSDLWLHEGFVSYAEVLFLEHSQGRDAALELLLTQRRTSMRARESLGRALVTTDYHFPDQLFDGVSYEGGSVFLHLLRHLVGDDAFFAAWQQWTRSQQNEAVSTRQFRQALQEFTSLDLEPVFREWVHSVGVPQIVGSWSYNERAGRLELRAEQVQRTPNLYHLPLPVAYSTGGQRRTVSLTMEERSSVWSVECDRRPDYVRFNDGGVIPGVFVIDQELDEWRAQFLHEEDPLGRWQAADALGRLLARKASSSSSRDDDEELEQHNSPREARRRARAALALGAVEDPFAPVRAAAAKALGKTQGGFARSVLPTILGDEELTVRAAAARALGRFRDDMICAEALLSRLPIEQEPFVQSAIFSGLAGLRSKEADRFLADFAARNDVSPDLVTGALRAARPQDVKDLAWDWSLDESRRLDQRKAAIEVLGDLAASDSLVAEHLVRLLQDNSLVIQYAALAGLAEVEDPQFLTSLVRYYQRAPVDDLKADTAGLLGQILRAVPADD